MDGRFCECVYAIAKELAYGQLCADMPLDESDLDKFSLNYYPTAKNEDGVSPRARMREIYSLCCKYADKFSLKSGNLLFLGGVGLGKTHLSLGIAKKVLEKGYGVIYGGAPTLLAAAEREHFSKEDNGALESYTSCDLLIIDDLGTELPGNFVTAALYNVINDRLLAGKSMVISTNLNVNEIAQRYSPQIASRLQGSFLGLTFVGQDIRVMKNRGF